MTRFSIDGQRYRTAENLSETLRKTQKFLKLGGGKKAIVGEPPIVFRLSAQPVLVPIPQGPPTYEDLVRVGSLCGYWTEGVGRSAVRSEYWFLALPEGGCWIALVECSIEIEGVKSVEFWDSPLHGLFDTRETLETKRGRNLIKM